MNWLRHIDRIADEHIAATRRLHDRVMEIEAEAKARARAMSDRFYAVRMAHEQEEMERREHAELERRARADEIERERQAKHAAVEKQWADRTVYPSDWNGDDEGFPMPKSWLV